MNRRTFLSLAGMAAVGTTMGMKPSRIISQETSATFGHSVNNPTDTLDGIELMDPQVVPDGNSYGEKIQVWEYTSYINDADYFMERNMAHYTEILTNDEPIDIFACPLFLPIAIQKEYYQLWTKQRMQQIIDCARVKGVAIEINDAVRVPHLDFIKMAKSAGLKFTFGSDTRDARTGRLDYCKQIAREAGLTPADFLTVKRKPFSV